MDLTPVKSETTVIGQVLAKFAKGDATFFQLIANDIDFRIDHFRDEADVSWQHASSRDGLMAVVARLGKEIFPKGTEPLEIECFDLKEGWYLTCFSQRFFYGLWQKDVTSRTYIISHEAGGMLDYFRETVTNIIDVA